MENNNYNNNNMENNADETINTTNTAGSASAGQQESGSTYSYSYLNQEQRNPNNVWRADENTADSSYSNTYNNHSGYGSSYNNNQSNTGSAYNNIYGNANDQAGWNTKTERAQKRAAKKANMNTNTNFGIKLAKCASIALVFGLVAGTTFEGASYLTGNLLGTNDTANTAVEQQKDQEVLKIGDTTKNTTPLTATASNTGDGVVAIVEQCMPSIVAITNMSQVQYQNWFGQVQKYEVPSAGSGIIVSEDNDYLYIATNNHVVESATTLTIQFSDDTTAAAEIKGTDVSTDLAVVQVKKADIEAETLSAIKVATLGDSEKIKVGSQAIAIGNALGYGQSVTAGYISALEREVTTQDETTGKSYTNNLIQTDAAINPGNSGGALLNSSGEVIGINSSKYNDTAVEGMGFAIPSNTAKPIIEDLITKHEVSDDKAAYLGIHGEDVTSSVSEAYNMPEGVFVKEVFKGTAAEQYGLQAGDIITKVDGREITSMEALHSRLSYYEAGTQVEVVVQRPTQSGYQETAISVVLGKKNS